MFSNLYPTCSKLIPPKGCPIILLRVVKCYVVCNMVKSVWVWFARCSEKRNYIILKTSQFLGVFQDFQYILGINYAKSIV